MPPKESNDESDLIKISELARRSGVPAPTIKHYMREGLLPGPARRTSRNMAYYDARLSDRVRTIKDLQQSHFLPLRLIGDLLEPAPSARVRRRLDPETKRKLGKLAPAIGAGTEKARQRRLPSRASDDRTRAELVRDRQISADDLTLLEELKLAVPRKSGGAEPTYSGADLELIEVIHETREKGMGDLFPMEILAPYADRMRRFVRFEIDLFRQRVIEGAKLPDAPMPEVAREATYLAERMIIAMRAKLIVPELQRVAAPQASSGERPKARRSAKNPAAKKPAAAKRAKKAAPKKTEKKPARPTAKRKKTR